MKNPSSGYYSNTVSDNYPFNKITKSSLLASSKKSKGNVLLFTRVNNGCSCLEAWFDKKQFLLFLYLGSSFTPSTIAGKYCINSKASALVREEMISHFYLRKAIQLSATTSPEGNCFSTCSKVGFVPTCISFANNSLNNK